MSHQLSINLARLAKVALRTPAKNLLVQQSAILGSQPFQGISTSKKPKETIAPAITTTRVESESETKVEQKKYWTSQGFDWTSEEKDVLYRNHTFFWTVTICIVTCSYIWLYAPDYKLKQWANREAYIELARREALGLPQVDPNLVPVENMVLPSEEELGDFDIII